MHLFCKKNDGIYAIGSNSHGQLGLGDTNNRTTFTKIELSDVSNIYYSNNDSYVLKNDGTLWSCGYNNSGELGFGDKNVRTEFTKVDIDDVKDVSCGNGYVYVLKNDGTLWSCGNNGSGQLGLGDNIQRNIFTKVDIEDVNYVYCGNSTTVIIKNDGTVWGCGYNYSDQLGLGTTSPVKSFRQLNISDVKTIKCGFQHIMVLKNDGTLYACGKNSNGQLGLGDTSNRKVFTKVDISDVKDIFCSNSFTYILKNDGSIWSTGYNTYGQLGIGNFTNTNTFQNVNVGFNVKNINILNKFSDSVCLLSDDNKLYECGYKFLLSEHNSTFTYTNNDGIKMLYPYKIEESTLFLIKSNNIYYTIDNNSQLIETTLDEFREKGVSIDVINNNIAILPNKFNLVSNDIGASVKLIGLKKNSYMITIPTSVDIPIAESIKKFSVDNVLDKSLVKVIISVDNGTTYYTCKNGNFEEISISIPQGDYNSFTDEQIIEWNTAKNKILMEGIDINDLNNINFNLLTFEKSTMKLKYALAIELDDTDSIANLKKVSMIYQTSN